MASHKPPRELRSDQDLYDLADQSKSTVLLIGSGASFQYADASRALQDTLKVLREENLYSDDQQVPAEELQKTLVFFGGDTAKDDAPDLGWLVRAVKRELGAKATVVSFQSWPRCIGGTAGRSVTPYRSVRATRRCCMRPRTCSWARRTGQ